MNHILLLMTLMFCTGVLGGTINYFITEKADYQKYNLIKCIVLGIGASFLVPLFLNMISSSLIMESSEKPELFLVIIGFCLVASISSKSFISGVSARLLKEVKETNEKYIAMRESEETIAGEDYEELNEYEESSKEDPITVLKQNISEMKIGEKKTLRQLYGNSSKWKEISLGARRGVGRRFYSQVKSEEISNLKPDGTTNYGSQYYRKT